MKVSETTRIK